MAYKCLFAIVFLACQVHTQASVEVPSGSKLLVTISPNQTGHMITEVSHDDDVTGSCESTLPSVEVQASTSSCSAQSYRHVKVTITIPPPSAPVGKLTPTLSPPSCPTSPPPPPSTPTPTPPVLLQGYERVPNLGCYKYHTEGATWTEAKQICEEEGTHLLILNSEDESKAISDIMRRDEYEVDSDSGFSWLGLIESNTTQHVYYTVFGDPLSSTGFSRWRPGQPYFKNFGDNVYLYSGDGGLGDLGGTNSRAFTCEQFTC